MIVDASPLGRGRTPPPLSQASKPEARLAAITGRLPARGPALAPRDETSIGACRPGTTEQDAEAEGPTPFLARGRRLAIQLAGVLGHGRGVPNLHPIFSEASCVGQEGSGDVKASLQRDLARSGGTAWDCAEVASRRSSSSSSRLPLRWRFRV